MSKKEEEAAALGKAMMNTVAAATRESMGEKLTGNAKMLNELLEEVAGQQQRLTLRIYRKGFGVNANQEEFVAPLYNVDPEMLRETGIEPMIQQYSGGGNYRIVITAPGIPMRTMAMSIAGEPLSPKPERDLRAAAGGAPIPPGFPFPMQGPLGAGFNASAPGAAQYFGLQGNYGQPATQSQSHIADFALMMQMMQGFNQKPSGESEELKKSNEVITELKAALARGDADKARIESERKADAQIAELKAQMEKLTAPKEDPYAKLLAMVPLLAPVITGYFTSRDQAAQAAAQAQRDAAQAQMTMMMTMLTSQGSASERSIELFKTMMLQPKETETDRMRGIMDIATSSMSTTMGLTQAMVNQMQAMQPGERPPWMEILMTLIENASAMGQAALESRGVKMPSGDDEVDVQNVGPVRVLKPGAAAAAIAAGDDEPQSVTDVASAAAAAAQENLSAPDENGMMTAEEARVAGITGAEEEDDIELPDFSAGAFKIIFEKITAEDGDVHEIAFRIWKHASSGDKVALAWVQNPQGYTLGVLDALAQSGRLLVTAERIHEISDAMADLFVHFRRGLDAVEYVKKYSLSISLPKRLMVVPLPPKQPGEVDGWEEEEEIDEQQDEQGDEEEPEGGQVIDIRPEPEEPPAPEAPKEPTQPTPSFGQAPPPRQTT